jgi:hypothetical protein
VFLQLLIRCDQVRIRFAEEFSFDEPPAASRMEMETRFMLQAAERSAMGSEVAVCDRTGTKVSENALELAF